jgi:hypothetical protein
MGRVIEEVGDRDAMKGVIEVRDLRGASVESVRRSWIEQRSTLRSRAAPRGSWHSRCVGAAHAIVDSTAPAKSPAAVGPS